ncbi:hypothetical protein GCM10027048_25260 [Hymenobacter coalescens]
MKKPTSTLWLALVTGSLLFATGCEQTTIAPAPTATAVQDLADDNERGIEIRVAGIYSLTGQRFSATLRVEGFRIAGGGEMYTMVSLSQIGGGLSKEDIALLEATQLAFFTNYPDNTAYSYFNAWQTETSSFRFSLSRRDLINADPTVVLNEEYIITLDQQTPKYNRISATIANIVALWNPATTNAAGQPSFSGSGLNASGLVMLADYLNSIAVIVGRP